MSHKGEAFVKIENIVHDLPEVNYKQVLYEAITNSIQANANNIEIRFIYRTLDFDKKDIKDKEKILQSIEVIDNGEGFTEKNIKAFKEYKTRNKFHLGCKGVGRFVFLKLFDKVEIISLDKKITFDVYSDLEPELQEKKEDKTIVKLLKPKKTITVDFDDLEKSIKEHFIAYFKLLSDEEKEVVITIFKDNEVMFRIKSKDSPKFIKREFNIKSHMFSISYIFNDELLPNDGYYCAGKRVVKKNSELEASKKLKIPKQIRITYLVESEYLDNNIKQDTRDDFTIYPKRKNSEDLMSNISWEEIQEKIKYEIEEIAKENGVDLEQLAKENIKKAIEKAPYLGFYINKNDELLESDELIKKAQKELEQDKEFLRNKENTNDVNYDAKLSIVTQAELAEYIFDREKVIEKLKQLTDERSLEKEIHNLFMKRKTTDEKQDYRTNHLWLFDDRFMTYDKIFSDVQIKEIFPKLSEILDRPDLLSIFSNTYDKEKITDIVVIELKRPDDKITPARAEEQLLDYAHYINENFENRKVRIWTYAFLKFNKDTERKLTSKGYNRVFTKAEYPLYYRPYPKENTIINFIDYKTLSYDAELRNKTFLNILKGNFI